MSDAAASLSVVMSSVAQARQVLTARVFPFLGKALEDGRRWLLIIRPETRTEAQNRLMWPILTEFSKQLEWPVNGRMVTMEPDEWKDVLSAAFYGETARLAMGLNGGVVLLGRRTSKFSKKQFSEWIEFLYATAADRDVRLPAWTGDAP